MRILIISDAWYPQINGVVRTYEYLTKELKGRDHHVEVIGPSHFTRCLPMPGYKEIKLVLFPYRRLKKKIEDFGPDAIHIGTEGPLGWAARKYCLNNNIKFTSSYHTQFPDYMAQRVAVIFPFLYRATHRLGINLIKKFHAPSSSLLITTDSMAEEMRSWGIGAPIQKFTRGIDINLFFAGDRHLFNDAPKPIALYVGRLSIEKNVEEFLQMPWEGSKVVVGQGPDEKYLRKKYPNAIFTGKKTGKELADHYRSADVFVFPSRTDTFGIVLIEALACGLPIAAHDVIGPRDIVINNTLGFLDENLSLAAHNALNIGNSKTRNAYVIENYSWKKAGDQFLNATQNTQAQHQHRKVA